MGTIIRSVAVAKSVFRMKIVRLAVRAVKKCLKKSGIAPSRVGILLNTSVYSEDHLGEPALASLIQRRIGITRLCKKSPATYAESMFSFDLHSGGGGVIAAFQVIDSLMKSGVIQNGLIVSGDAKPVSGYTENFHYAPGAAALLLSSEEGKEGFCHFRTDTYHGFINDLESSINWDSGKFTFAVHQKNDYLKNCVSCTVQSIHRLFEEKHLTLEQIDLVITSQNPKGFTGVLKKETGFNNKVVEMNGKKDYYSAGIIFALHKVFNSHKFLDAKNILYLTVGSGITVSLALYKN